jgi:hypothetical protein
LATTAVIVTNVDIDDDILVAWRRGMDGWWDWVLKWFLFVESFICPSVP